MNLGAAAVTVLLLSASAGCFGSSSPGLSAPESWEQAYLVDTPLPGLVVEIHAVDGYRPSPAVLADYEGMVRQVVRKERVEIRVERLDPQGGDYTPKDILELGVGIAGDRLGRAGDGSNGVLLMLVLDGIATDAPEAGVYLGFGISAVFPDSWRPNGLLVEDRLMLDVMTHETGHAFGLVNKGVPMVHPHEDLDHGGHSSNADSVMYWQTAVVPIDIERLSIGLLGKTFDANDLADIRAFQDSFR